MGIRHAIAFTSALIVSTLTQLTQAALLVGITQGGTLYDINPQTGLASNPRGTGLETDFVIGLEFTRGQLYATTAGGVDDTISCTRLTWPLEIHPR